MHDGKHGKVSPAGAGKLFKCTSVNYLSDFCKLDEISIWLDEISIWQRLVTSIKFEKKYILASNF